MWRLTYRCFVYPYTNRATSNTAVSSGNPTECAVPSTVSLVLSFRRNAVAFADQYTIDASTLDRGLPCGHYLCSRQRNGRRSSYAGRGARRLTMSDAQDSNAYSVGRIYSHNVVIACLPAGLDGLAAAALGASNMLRTFGQLRFGLLVGVGGGVPDLERGVDV